MSEFEDMYSYEFYWFSMPSACPQCAALHGQVFQDQSLHQPVLIDPVTVVPIWDLYSDRPLTHGGTGKNCNCRLEVRTIVDFTQLEEYMTFNQLMGQIL